ncbi:MAG TPA: hypothetical protein VFG15_27430 [Amycolatopsis sp.]|nr:hypothetical protein [Amycolatopsis sp.]
MADERTYIRVHDGIEDHPKTAALTDKGFRLLVTTWGWCSRHRTDGRVPLAVWKKRGTKGSRDELVRARLVEVHDDHVMMHDYLEHQRSSEFIAEKIEAKKRGARLGNHRRWHVEGKKYDPACEFCVEDTPPEPPDEPPPPPGKRSHSDRSSESDHRSRSDHKTSPETETETETETEKEKELRDLPSSLPVGDTRARGRGATGPHSAAGYRLVDRVLGRRLTSGTRSSLAFEVSQLLAEATEAELAEALRRWNQRTGIGPRLLGALVDDLRKEAHGATARPTHTAPPVNGTDAYAAQFLAGGQTAQPALRALPGGA